MCATRKRLVACLVAMACLAMTAGNAFATATTLSAGDVAIVGYNTASSGDVNGPDSVAFVVLQAVGSGT